MILIQRSKIARELGLFFFFSKFLHLFSAFPQIRALSFAIPAFFYFAILFCDSRVPAFFSLRSNHELFLLWVLFYSCDFICSTLRIHLFALQFLWFLFLILWFAIIFAIFLSSIVLWFNFEDLFFYTRIFLLLYTIISAIFLASIN